MQPQPNIQQTFKQIYTYKTWILSVGLFVCLFAFSEATKSPSFMKFWLIWANLKHDEVRFLNFAFSRILGAFFVFFYLGFGFVFVENLSHFNT